MFVKVEATEKFSLLLNSLKKKQMWFQLMIKFSLT